MTDRERQALNNALRNIFVCYKLCFLAVMKTAGTQTAGDVQIEMLNNPACNKRLLQDAYKAALHDYIGLTRIDDNTNKSMMIATQLAVKSAQEAQEQERENDHGNMEDN